MAQPIELLKKWTLSCKQMSFVYYLSAQFSVRMQYCINIPMIILGIALGSSILGTAGNKQANYILAMITFMYAILENLSKFLNYPGLQVKYEVVSDQFSQIAMEIEILLSKNDTNLQSAIQSLHERIMAIKTKSPLPVSCVSAQYLTEDNTLFALRDIELQSIIPQSNNLSESKS
jgi:hypothetical protein